MHGPVQCWGKIFATVKQTKFATVPRRALSLNPYLHSNKKQGGGDNSTVRFLRAHKSLQARVLDLMKSPRTLVAWFPQRCLPCLH